MVVDRGFVVFNDSIDLSDSKVNFLDKLVMVMQTDPLLNILRSVWFDVLGNVERSKLLLIHHCKILHCFWCFTKVVVVGALVDHVSKLVNL